MIRRLVAATVFLALGASQSGMAEQKRPAQPPAPAPAASAPASPAPASPIAIEQALYLIRSTLMTLNDANRSGNYSVLRDLAAPSFQTANTAADLAVSFSDLRRRKFDLFAAALAAPQLTAAPRIDPQGALHLIGYFPTRPMQINFELMYQIVDGTWRLVAISVATPEVPVAPPQAQAPVPTPSASAAPKPKAAQSPAAR